MYLFGLIGLIMGSIIGMFIMKIKMKKKYQRKIFQNSVLEKKINKINIQQKELEKYFHNNMHLLDTINNNYQELYQDMIKNSNISYVNQNTSNIKKHISKQNDIKYNKNSIHLDFDSTKNNEFLVKEPRDYPEHNK